jgi:opacity protein-like surface antigen
VIRQHLNAPVLLALASLLAARPLAAGEPLGTNLFGGYSYLKLDESSRHGANLALDFRAFGPVAGFVDLSSHWGSEEGVSLNDVTLMAGPGVRFGTRGATIFFVRALAGLVRDKGTISAFDVDISETDSRFGVLAGGGADFRVSKKLAARVQADYLWNDVTEGGSSSGFRVSAGVVYRFGIAP